MRNKRKLALFGTCLAILVPAGAYVGYSAWRQGNLEKARKIEQEQKKELRARDELALDRVRRSALRLKAATEVGVTYQDFSAALLSYAGEIAVAEESIQTLEAGRALAMYKDSLERYRDSQIVWYDEIKHNYLICYEPRATDPHSLELVRIVREYDAPTSKFAPSESVRCFDQPTGTIRTIWNRASDQIMRAKSAP